VLRLVAQTNPPPILLTNAHAHNDYEHKRPLFDALDNGFTSVEADIWLVDGKLLVAHDLDAVKPERTLQALYLDPLREIIHKNGGRVYRNGPSFTLLIELKSDGETIYPVLREDLKPYRDLLTVYERRPGKPDKVTTKAITVIITGNRPRPMIAADNPRYAAIDGDFSDLDSDAPADLIPWISDSWLSEDGKHPHFHWIGFGPFPDAERQKLREIVAKAHQHGRKVRLWASPDYPKFWTLILDEGVDLANVDHLPEFQKFMQQRTQATPSGK
jgi:hypothetical protein